MRYNFCECEHEDHFAQKDPSDFSYVRLRAASHEYGAVPPDAEYLVEGYGRMCLCKTCAETCLKEYIK